MGRLTPRLSRKLTTCLVGSMLVVFFAVGYHNVELHRRHLEELTFQSADSLGGVIKASMRHSMLNNQRYEIFETIKAIGIERGIHGIRIFNKEGRISFSSDPGEVDSLVDTNAEACYRCHAAEEPLERLNQPDRVRIFTGADGTRLLGLINPIENEPSCSGLPCHAHDQDQRVLGVLDVTMSLAHVDETISAGETRLIRNLVLAVAVVAAIFALLIWRLVHRPIRALFAGTRRVAAGELDHKILVSTRDEMGQLATSFNRMTDELRRAQDELRDWAGNLERRVDEKTAELRQTHEQMIQVERMASMGKLAAVVAHEINNPLMGILAASRLLLKKLDAQHLRENGASSDREDLEMIASESARCGEIVKSLLQFARRGQGDYTICDARELAQESLRLVQHKLELTNVRTETRFCDQPARISCDPQEIRQALVAVLINACEAMADGEREGLLEVSINRLEESGTVRIHVTDDGLGMDEETQKHIFEPFFTTKTAGAGAGLGLAVASGIVARHSGSIEVDSVPGGGTRVCLVLPAADLAPSTPQSAGEKRAP